MNKKTPEEYFKEYLVPPGESEEGDYKSSYEIEFIKKFLGGEVPLSQDVKGQKIATDQVSKDLDIKKLKEVQLVGFCIGNKEISFPIHEVREVIKKIEYTTLPSSPPFVVGVINLRNRIIPLLDIMPLLDDDVAQSIEDYRFIVICDYNDFGIGVFVNKITTMYKVAQNDIEWNIEAKVGASGIMKGVFENKEILIGILDLEKLVNLILNK